MSGEGATADQRDGAAVRDAADAPPLKPATGLTKAGWRQGPADLAGLRREAMAQAMRMRQQARVGRLRV